MTQDTPNARVDGKLSPLFTWRSAVCESGLPPTTRHVALTLSLYMNERGGSAFPGASRLSHDTGLHEDSVRKHLLSLVHAGWLRQTHRGGLKGAKRTANTYVATVPPPVENRGSPPEQDRGSRTAPPEQDSLTPRAGPGQSVIESVNLFGAEQARPTKRAQQLPDSWQPTEQHYRMATERGLSVEGEAEQFEDYHRAKGSTMKDWDRAFNTWLRNASKFAGRGLRAVDDPRYSDDPAIRAQAYGTTITDRSRPAWMDRKDA
jgi:hypothetical protein